MVAALRAIPIIRPLALDFSHLIQWLRKKASSCDRGHFGHWLTELHTDNGK
jgi:hypothetical protein